MGSYYLDARDAGACGDSDPEPLDKVNCEGQTILPGETLDSMIGVWEIAPGFGGYDFRRVRDYHRAMRFAHDRMDALMEGVAEGVPVKVEAKIVRVRLGDYLESLSED